MKKVMVQPNPIKDTGLGVTQELIRVLLKYEFQVLMRKEIRPLINSELDREVADRVRFYDDEDIYKECDFIMVSAEYFALEFFDSELLIYCIYFT